jgi:ABC-type multidrug transport system fused ATPase/permease subunit
VLFNEGQVAEANEIIDNSIRELVIYLVVLAAATFVVGYGQMSLWMITAERQSKEIREQYYASLLKQNVAWFEQTNTGELTSRLASDVSIIQEGMGEKLGSMIQNFAMFITGFIIAFIKGWRLTLVLLACIPLLGLGGALTAKALSEGSSESQNVYAQAGAMANEAFSAIRTVTAFGGQQHEYDRYYSKITIAYRAGIKRAWVNGLGIGFMVFMVCTARVCDRVAFVFLFQFSFSLAAIWAMSHTERGASDG